MAPKVLVHDGAITRPMTVDDDNIDNCNEDDEDDDDDNDDERRRR